MLNIFNDDDHHYKDAFHAVLFLLSSETEIDFLNNIFCVLYLIIDEISLEMIVVVALEKYK
jgi:hypothetical protein